MKQIKWLALFSAMMVGSAFAQQGGFVNQNMQMGGFAGPTSANAINTVKQALNAGVWADDTPVSLTGYITSSLGNEHYIFSDGSGEIRVEIDNDDWRGIQATPKTKLTIVGELDRKISGMKVDVDAVFLAQ
ncbi:MAG: YgiW/YdeI family stress tolerance OB fold protein [Vibrionaceae bacterium]